MRITKKIKEVSVYVLLPSKDGEGRSPVPLPTSPLSSSSRSLNSTPHESRRPRRVRRVRRVRKARRASSAAHAGHAATQRTQDSRDTQHHHHHHASTSSRYGHSPLYDSNQTPHTSITLYAASHAVPTQNTQHSRSTHATCTQYPQYTATCRTRSTIYHQYPLMICSHNSTYAYVHITHPHLFQYTTTKHINRNKETTTQVEQYLHWQAQDQITSILSL